MDITLQRMMELRLSYAATSNEYINEGMVRAVPREQQISSDLPQHKTHKANLPHNQKVDTAQHPPTYSLSSLSFFGGFYEHTRNILCVINAETQLFKDLVYALGKPG